MKQPNDNHLDILSPSAAEAALTVTKVATGVAVAVLGGPPGTDGVAVALVDSLIRPFMTRRYANFANGVMDRLEKAEKQIDTLLTTEDEHFATIYIQAAREAIITHEKEKIEALQNAVINTGVGINIDEETQLFLLSVTSQLSLLHIRVLRYAAANGSASIGTMVKEVFKAGPLIAKDQLGIISRGLITDLESRGLMEERVNEQTEHFAKNNSMMARLIKPQFRITPLGKSLVAYLGSPT